MENEIFYELGRLNTYLSCIVPKVSTCTLNFMARECKYSLSLNKKRVQFSEIFDPNVINSDNKNIITVVKYIKAWDFALKSNKMFGADFILEFYNKLSSTQYIDKPSMIDIDYDSLKGLYELYKLVLSRNKNPINELYANVLVNLYFVKQKKLSAPLIDMGYSVSQCGKPKSYEDFLTIILYALKNSNKILLTQKEIFTADKKIIDEISVKSTTSVYKYVMGMPVFEVGEASKELELTFATTSKAFSILEKEGIIRKSAGNLRYRIFEYGKIVDLYSK